jgi:hypothetical protein
MLLTVKYSRIIKIEYGGSQVMRSTKYAVKVYLLLKLLRQVKCYNNYKIGLS